VNLIPTTLGVIANPQVGQRMICDRTRVRYLPETAFGREQSANGESGDFGTHSIGGGDLDAEVVEGAAVARIFQQHQFEWGFGTQLVTRQAHR
jgi:hypothetical protein